MTVWRRGLVLATLAALAAPVGSRAGQRDSVPAAADPASLDEALSLLLMDSLHARTVLRERGERQRADAFWGSASRFAAAVRDADPDDQPMFLPIIAGFRTGIGDSITGPSEPDRAGLDEIQSSLDEQILIQTSPGATASSRGGVRIAVNAIRDTAQVPGLYVWIDLSCCVPRNGSTALALPGVTPTTAIVGPGRYVVRLMRGNRPVGRKVATIGRQGPDETVTVQVEQP
jgi:hypothetical protein